MADLVWVTRLYLSSTQAGFGPEISPGVDKD